MLQCILGRSGSGKTQYIRDLILRSKKDDTYNEKFILLVPEEYYFENERKLLDILGERFNNNIKVLSFKKLIKFIYQKLNKAPIKSITKAEKSILMSLAIENVQDKLNLFKNASYHKEFVDLMLSSLNEFKMCNIDDNKLQDFEKLSSGTLAKKIYETRLIINSYKTLLSNKYNDPLDDITKAYKMLLENDVFHGYSIIADGFDYFTNQQLLLIEKLLIQCKNFYITFCTTGLEDKSTDIFFLVNKNLSRILTIAKNNDVEILPEINLNSSKRFLDKDIKFLEENIFQNKKSFTENKPQNINLYSAQNKYDEVNFVCNKIKELIINHGYRFKDIAIITRNTDTYKGVLDVSLEKFDIPYFMEKKESIDSKPLMKFVINTFNVIIENFSSESITKYLKTGLLNFSTNEISLVENYTISWKISCQEWKSGFYKVPNGIRNKANLKLLEQLNSLRKKIILPLINFEKALKNSTAINISKAIYTHLKEISICDTLKTMAQRLTESDNVQLAEEIPTLWNLLMDILSQISEILGEKLISIKEYLNLLILVMNSNEISFIQKSLDEVSVENADILKSDNIKVIFLIGANQGEFPRTPISSGIFKNDERNFLLKAGLNLQDPLENIAIKEKFLAYKAVSNASEKLFISWANSSISGEKKMESEIVKEAKEIFKDIPIHSKSTINAKDEIFSIKSSFEVCSRHFNDKTEFSETLKCYFQKREDFKDKINLLECLSKKSVIKFEEPKNINTIIKNELKLSPSSIEQYHLCPFSFFCKYILKIKNNKPIDFNQLEYGSLFHYVLENIFSNYEPQKILEMSQSSIFQIIRKYISSYIENNFGGIKNLSSRQQYLINRSKSSIYPVVKHIAEELLQSKFIPKEFELSISKVGKIKPLKIDIGQNKIIEISGKIDRLDIMNKSGISYVRVVDYKTGAKEFKLKDLDYGLNIQMLLYLHIILKNAKDLYGHMIPAGILYMPAKKPIISASKNIPADKVYELKNKKLQMNGLILNSTDVILGMEPKGTGTFIPAVIKDGEPKKSDFLADLNEMNHILDRIHNLVIKMGNEVFNSKISVYPIKGKKDACEYCEFSSICRFENGDPVNLKTI